MGQQEERITIEQILEQKRQVKGYDASVYTAICKHWDRVAKPLDGMGTFEPMLAQIGAIQRKENPQIERGKLCVFCSDNGIVEEGISQSTQEVTAICAKNIAAGSTAVGRMVHLAGCAIQVIDLGINTNEALPGVIDRKVAMGTKNFFQEDAMNLQQMKQAMQCGMDAVYACKQEQLDFVCIGEMGIGNTTTSSAIACAMLHLDPLQAVGRGAGLSDAGLLKKEQVIRQTIGKKNLEHAGAEEVMCAVGGFDIAGMAGACMAAALYEIPLILDGMISMVAALVAETLLPGTKEYLIASHSSKEPATCALVQALSLHPVIDARMALGEGTGAMMLLPMLHMAKAVYEETNSFAAAGVETYQRYEETR